MEQVKQITGMTSRLKHTMSKA